MDIPKQLFNIARCCIFTVFSLGRRKYDSSYAGVAQKSIIVDWVLVDFLNFRLKKCEF